MLLLDVETGKTEGGGRCMGQKCSLRDVAVCSAFLSVDLGSMLRWPVVPFHNTGLRCSLSLRNRNFLVIQLIMSCGTWEVDHALCGNKTLLLMMHAD